MPDNIPVTAGVGTTVLADEVSYSGDTAKLQGVELFLVTGAEGSRVATKIPADAATGLATYLAAALAPADHGLRSYPVAPDGICDAAGNVYTLKFATATSTADGEFSIVAAVTNKKIRVLSIAVSVITTAGLFSLKAGAAGATIWQSHIIVGTPFGYAAAPPNAICETAVSGALIGNNAAGVDSFVNVSYIEC